MIISSVKIQRLHHGYWNWIWTIWNYILSLDHIFFERYFYLINYIKNSFIFDYILYLHLSALSSSDPMPCYKRQFCGPVPNWVVLLCGIGLWKPCMHTVSFNNLVYFMNKIVNLLKMYSYKYLLNS